jgi:hypothetical protein
MFGAAAGLRLDGFTDLKIRCRIMTSALNTALIRLAPRAEQNDPATLLSTFVDTGPLFTLLSSKKHQVLYGRRGTGKTHALQYLGERVRKDGEHAVYIDLRQLGSTGGLYGDSAISIQQRATQLLVDALLAITNGIFAEIFGLQGVPEALDRALNLLSELQDTVSQVRVVGEIDRETRSSVKAEESSVGSAAATLASTPTLTFGSHDGSSRTAAVDVKRTEKGTEEHSVHF